MNEKCFDIGTIQAFLDGELAPDLSETVANHVALCDACSNSFAAAEEESIFAFSALEQEFNTLVPTQRLWTKINDSLESEKKSVWQNVFAFVSNFKSYFSNQTIVAFASLLIVFGLFAAVLILRNNNDSSDVARVAPSKETTIAPIVKSDAPPEFANQKLPILPKERTATNNSEFVDSKNGKTEYRVVKATFGYKENRREPIKIKPSNGEFNNRLPYSKNETQTANENIAGEESYVKTIATLTETVNNRKDEVLRPSARVAFEKDLAVVDDAITKMKAEVKKNPKNEGAKQVLLSSYQNKIDLLNSVTEKNELMASLK